MATTIRVLFVVNLFLAYTVSTFLIISPEGLMIFLLVFGWIALIISTAAIQVDLHKRREESIELPLLLPLLPAILYCMNLRSMELHWSSFFHFCTQFLFWVNVAGFLLGLILAPLWAKLFGKRKNKADEIAKTAWSGLKSSPVLIFAFVLLAGVVTTLFFSAKILVAYIQLFGQWQKLLTYFSLACGTCLVIRLTFRSSRWGDPLKFSPKGSERRREY